MDQLISYETVAEFPKNPPTLLPHPDFTKLHALQKHMARALKQLVCPQSTIHRWLGLVSLPMMYTLLELNPFLALGIPRGCCGIPTVCTPGANQDSQRHVCTIAERMEFVQEHPMCMLPHAGWKCSQPVQGVKHSHSNQVEYMYVY
jgi:hypothetical protein